MTVLHNSPVLPPSSQKTETITDIIRGRHEGMMGKKHEQLSVYLNEFWLL